MSALSSVLTFGRMIKFSHSIFALPFAFSGAALAAAQAGISVAQVAWITLAMVGARSAAMGFNRLADRHLDAANPRTAGRELPQGVVSPVSVALLVVLSSAALVFAAWQLNPLCLYLSPLVLAELFFYSLCKRFTWASHLVLGLSLGGAPLGAWIAVTGSIAWPPILLGLAVLLWVAGFDIFYACQDMEFDRIHGLNSIPARFGVRRSLSIARWLHLATVIALASVALVTPLSGWYLAGVAGVGLLLTYEQSLVRVDDLSRVKQAVDLNGYVGFFYLAATAAAIYVG